jgi:hypothetical protein
MATKISEPKTKKATLAALHLEVAKYLLELCGPSILKLAKDKRRRERTRWLLLQVARQRVKEGQSRSSRSYLSVGSKN